MADTSTESKKPWIPHGLQLNYASPIPACTGFKENRKKSNAKWNGRYHPRAQWLERWEKEVALWVIKTLVTQETQIAGALSL